MNALKSLTRCRAFTTSAGRRRTMEEFKEIQRRFQVDDGLPVYLKKGSSDRIIFGLVAGATAGLTAYSLYTAKRILFPAPPS